VLIAGGSIFTVSIVVQMFYQTTSWAVNITAYQATNSHRCNHTGSPLTVAALFLAPKAFKWGTITGLTTGGVLFLAAANIRRM